MKNKLQHDITTTIVRTTNIGKTFSGLINIHHRDAKRILQGKVWNSRKIHYDGEPFVATRIQRSFIGDTIDWLLYLEDIKNGETRVTPMYEIEFVKHSHYVSTNNSNKNYIVFKKK